MLVEISFDLIFNWNQTGIHYVLVGLTIEKEELSEEEIVAADSKRQITESMQHRLQEPSLPPQLICKDKTDWCLSTAGMHQHCRNMKP